MLKTNRAWNSTYLNWGTGIPCTDKRAHAPGREPIYLSSQVQKLPVFNSETQSDSFKYFLNEESQIYYK